MDRSSNSAAPLRGSWLKLAQIIWVAVALLGLGILLAAIPFYYHGLVTFSLPNIIDPKAVQANLAAVGISPSLYAISNMALRLIFALFYMSIAVVIFIRRSSDVTALVFSLALFVLGIVFCDIPTVLGEVNILGRWLFNLYNYLSFMLFIAAFYIFPNGRFVPAWTRWLLVFWIVFGVPYLLLENTQYAIPIIDVPIVQLFLFIAPVTSVVLFTLYRYRRVSNNLERQQTKWAVSGFSVALFGFLLGGLVAIIFPRLMQPGTIGELVIETLFFTSMALIPLSIGMAVMRSHLWDIDLIIRRTLAYSLLTVTLALIYYGFILVAQFVFQQYMHHASTLVIVVTTITIAALFSPLRRRIQTEIDRRFYRRKYDAAQTMEAFSAYLRTEVDLDAMCDWTVAVIEDVLQPEHVSLWLRTPTVMKTAEIRSIVDEEAET